MIYLDNAATTACASEVVEAMLPFFRQQFANASSIDHAPGTAARRVVEDAREMVAEMVGSHPEDVIFTSGATEANNLALSVSRRVITTSIEHPSVLDPFKARERNDDQFVALDQNGLVDKSSLLSRLADGTSPAMVSAIATNNETGVEQDVSSLRDLTANAGALLHLDATQAVATRQFELRRDAIAGLSVSAHKIYGPKGIGALIASPSLRREIRPLLRGGGHERGFRSGTLNVPGIVGFGTAARLVLASRSHRREHLSKLRSHFIATVCSVLSDSVAETIHDAPISPHILSLRLRGTNGRALLGALRDEVAFSLGSACATNKAEPSHVLVAIGIDKRAISETIRISFSADQTAEDVASAALRIAEAARALSDYSVPA